MKDREVDGQESKREPLSFSYVFRPDAPKEFFAPENPYEAITYLLNGNRKLSRFYAACQCGGLEPGESPPRIEISHNEAHGLPIGPDGLPVQYPFVAVIGCSDARVPTEILFGQEFNDIFNIRVAGNVLMAGSEGSLLYVLRNFVVAAPGSIRPRNLKLVIALGHRGCGAVRAAVDAYQASGDPSGSDLGDDSLSATVKTISVPVVGVGVEAFDRIHGEGASREKRNVLPLVELMVYLNAAWVGHRAKAIALAQGEAISSQIEVVYGVFDPSDYRVRGRPPLPDDPPGGGLFDIPPQNLEALRGLALNLARDIQVPEVPLLA